MTETAQITVTRNDEQNRYEIHLDDTLGGFAEFSRERGMLVFFHTEIDPAYKGKGLGTTLVGEAMVDVAQRGEVVSPVCPFVKRYLSENDIPGLEVAASTDDGWRAGSAEPAT